MKLAELALAALMALSLAACDRSAAPEAASASASASTPTAASAATPAAAIAPAAPVAPMPDVGKLGSVTVNAKGTGASAAEAVDEAIRLALKQANGQTVDLSSEQFKLTLSLARGKDSEALRANAFAEHIVQSSGGAITGFKLNRLDGPDRRGFYQADLDAEVARFTPAAADSKKLKIVVAPLRYEGTSFPVGGGRVAADKLAEDLRQQILAALTNTGRFTVLDRDLGDELTQELDLIASGQTPRAEVGKLGQALSADVVWVGRIASFAYNRHARKLQTSDRELVSYSGGWAVSQKLVNVATRQVMLSDSLSGSAPSVAATTLGTGIDGARVSEGMQNGIANRIVSGILSRTFPVTVISIDGGAAVLSQGGQAVREGARYQLVHMGKEMFDPQTGQSLGRVESDCCEILVDRVTSSMAQGRLERVQMNLDGLQPGALQLRGMLPARVAAVAGDASDRPAGAAPAPKAKAAPQRSGDKPAAAKPAVVDDKW